MLAHAQTLSGLVRTNALVHTERTAFIDGGASITYGALDRRTNRLANHLVDMGVEKDDRIALLVLDGLPSIELIIAAGKIGAIAVAINWRLAAPEISHILNSCAPKCLFVSNRFSKLTPADGAYAEIEFADETSPESEYWRLTNAGDDILHAKDVFGGDPLYMLYTSGTTGKPKGCLQTHDGTVCAGLAFALRRRLGPDTSAFSSSPLFHVAGLSQTFATLACGGRTVFMSRDGDGKTALRLASDHQCTIASLNPLLFKAFHETWVAEKSPLFLRSMTVGAGMTPANYIRRLKDDWNCDCVGGYGQTEIGGFATFIDGAEMIDHPTALGWPLPHLEMTLLDDEGVPDWSANEGEIGLRGRSVMAGYWNNTEASEAALGTGWLRTGDIARRDENGWFHMLGRSKELIKTGGENVYPKEVEEVLLTHPAIADAAIAGVRNAAWGEAVKAFIVTTAEHKLKPSEVADWCRGKIAGYKRPRYVEFTDVIPRDPLGKIQRTALSQRTVLPNQSTDTSENT
jgi:fatty-acyl-CoA synthase